MPGQTVLAMLGIAFSTPVPDAPSTLALQVAYPEGHIRALRISLPPGARFDTSVTPTCPATNDAIRLLGPSACPPETKLGTGSLTAETGVAPLDPFRGDAHLFNGGDELIEVITIAGTQVVVAIERLRIEGNALAAEPPPAPGMPPHGTAAREVGFTIGPPGIVRTPPKCGKRRRWVSRGEFAFAQGTTAQAKSVSRCARPPAPRKRGRPGSRRRP